MCGRYANSATTTGLYGEFGIDPLFDFPHDLSRPEPRDDNGPPAEPYRPEDLPPSWNIAPTDPVQAVLQRPPRGQGEDAAPVRQLRTVRWGLVPSWAKDAKGGARLINARSETVSVKPAFKAAAGRRRCLLPAIGYYEWQKTEDPAGRIAKMPHFLHAADGSLLAFAGLYELWPDPAVPEDDPRRWLWTCTVITQQATDTLGEIHDRCPVIVPPEFRDDWLDCSSGDPAVAARLIEAMPEPQLEPRIVSTAVNSVRNDGPELIEPVPAPADVAPADLTDSVSTGLTRSVQQELDLGLAAER